MKRPIRVLIVDDSATVRKVLSEALSPEADIEVVRATRSSRSGPTC